MTDTTEASGMMVPVMLLPCPHCGEAEHLYRSYHRDPSAEKPHAIDCLGCGTDFVPRDGMDVVAAWNRRAIPPDYAKRIAELEGERDAVLAEYELIPAAELNATVKRFVAEAQLAALRSLVTEAAAVFGPALRIFDAVRLSAGLGKSQVERIDAAKALLTRLNEAVKP